MRILLGLAEVVSVWIVVRVHRVGGVDGGLCVLVALDVLLVIALAHPAVVRPVEVLAFLVEHKLVMLAVAVRAPSSETLVPVLLLCPTVQFVD